MTPDDIARRCEAWCVGPTSRHKAPRRVVCVEPDESRRTWLLFEGGRQVGHVRGRNPAGEDMEREGAGTEWVARMMRSTRWTWEAANAGREVLGG